MPKPERQTRLPSSNFFFSLNVAKVKKINVPINEIKVTFQTGVTIRHGLVDFMKVNQCLKQLLP